ncbi:hypothetical protein B0T22DRAFT_437255 [Podospora appendiculata]|uniref:Uncharacterized protein n=1 Tax=Podospora appendiculata TaxID=314037 RepID=A0AAE1CGX8_9PEZI|nr:hypothetical protein B0T22DRAFT_437255 [Podospora appendiculata]
MTYFETITSKRVLRRHTHKYPPLYRRKQHDLPAASGWGTEELFASRSGVLRYRTASSSAFLEPPSRPTVAELSRIIDPLQPGNELLAETELMLLLGGTAGMFWAALHRFTGPQHLRMMGADVHADAHSDADDLEMPDLGDVAGIGAQSDDHLPSLAPCLPQRTRRQAQQHPDYVDSSHIQIASSSPVPDSHQSSSFASDNVGYVSREEHTRRAISEDATVELASAFLRHALVYCQLQNITSADSSSLLLLEYSGMRRPDGEIALLDKHSAAHFVRHGEVLALLEAKKHFNLIQDGRPVITDRILGQVAVTPDQRDNLDSPRTVVIILATRQYLCFPSFNIPDAYVERFQYPDELRSQNDRDMSDDDGGSAGEDDGDGDDDDDDEAME